MKEFKVKFYRRSYFTIYLNAIDEDDANEKAIDMACEDPHRYELDNGTDEIELISVSELLNTEL
tara:strand:- start:306 stop:497 length:192 start_codon:yes stop_codon:yes gene_type:complete